MTCRYCGAEFPVTPDLRECPKCHFKLGSVEPQPQVTCACGTQAQAGSKFCKKCGKALSPVKSPSSAVASPTLAAAPIAPAVPGPVNTPDEPTTHVFGGGSEEVASAPRLAAAQPVPVPPQPQVAQKKPIMTLLALGGGGVLVLLLAIWGSSNSHSTPAAVPLPVVTAPTAAPVVTSLLSIQQSPEWFLKGGEVTGGFVSLEAQKDWPEWMQALIGGKQWVSPEELARANFYRIPDAFLPRALSVLEQERVFTPELLQQISAISYVADTGSWRQARSSYQKAYLAGNPLPLADPVTCSRVLTQLTLAKEYATVRLAMQMSTFPVDTALRASYLRMVDLEEGLITATPDMVADQALPAAERLSALMNVPKAAATPELLASLRSSDLFGNAIFTGVSKGWITITDPMVEEAIQTEWHGDPDAPWFLIQKTERLSDLLWLRVVDAINSGQSEAAKSSATALLDRFPDSYYSGHAIYALSSLQAGSAGHLPRLRIPSDVSIYNAESLTATAPGTDWPSPFDTLAAQGRFDLILARADLASQSQVFLKAAAMAGQQDLVGRYLALEKKCSADSLALLYPQSLTPVLEKLIQEEGLAGLVEPAFALSVIKCESLFQPSASSSADASGLMQLLKPTFGRMMGKQADIRDPLTNIRGGLRYFKQIIKTAGLEGLPRDVRYAYLLAGYHAGEGRAKTWRLATEAKLNNGTGPGQKLLRVEAIPIYSTKQYLTRVLGDYEIYKRLQGAPSKF